MEYILQYTYFVSYSYVDKNLNLGFGNIQTKIDDLDVFENIKKLEDKIKTENKFNKVTILHYRQIQQHNYSC